MCVLVTGVGQEDQVAASCVSLMITASSPQAVLFPSGTPAGLAVNCSRESDIAEGRDTPTQQSAVYQ